MNSIGREKQNVHFTPLGVEGFDVPVQWHGGEFVLVPAGPEWAELDFDAVMSSREALVHLFGPDDDWPPENLTLEEDRADLVWHAREFRARTSFAYHLLTLQRDRCLGCLYLYPTASRRYEAEAYLWIRSDVKTSAPRMEASIVDWVEECWPFSEVAWPGRAIAYEQWQAMNAPNYYAVTR